MSKLKVTTISDPDNDNTAISVDSSGNLTVPQNLTVSGTLSGDGSSLTGISSTNYADTHFQAYMSSTPFPASATWYTAPFNAELHDTDSGFNTSTYTYTVPTGKGGKWCIYYSLFVRADTSNLKQTHAGVQVNSNAYYNLVATRDFSTNYIEADTLASSGIINLSAGDTLVLKYRHVSWDASGLVMDHWWQNTGNQVDMQHFGGFRISE